MPSKSKADNTPELLEQLQKTIESKFNVVADKFIEFIAHIETLDKTIEKQDGKIDALDDCVKQSFEQFNRKIAEQGAKISALENFKTSQELTQANRQKFLSYSLWIVWGVLGALIAAVLDKTILNPLFEYFNN